MLLNPKAVTCLLISAILLSGCNQASQTPPANKLASTTPSMTSASVPNSAIIASKSPSTIAQDAIQNAVKETDTAEALLTVLAGLTFKSFNENPKQKLIAAQKNCLKNADYQMFLPNFQRYLQNKLTADELTKTNQFYALPVGQKQIQLANQQLLIVKDEKVNSPITLTDDEKLQMQAFQGTPEGQKLAQLLSPQNQSDLEKVLTEPMTKKVMADCHIQAYTMAPVDKSINSASYIKP